MLPYREEKNKLTSEKKTLTEKIARLEQTRNVWLEPLRNWIKDAQTLNEIDETTPVPLPKIVRSKNLRLEPRFKKSKNRIYR